MARSDPLPAHVSSDLSTVDEHLVEAVAVHPDVRAAVYGDRG